MNELYNLANDFNHFFTKTRNINLSAPQKKILQ